MEVRQVIMGEMGCVSSSVASQKWGSRCVCGGGGGRGCPNPVSIFKWTEKFEDLLWVCVKT